MYAKSSVICSPGMVYLGFFFLLSFVSIHTSGQLLIFFSRVFKYDVQANTATVAL